VPIAVTKTKDRFKNISIENVRINPPGLSGYHRVFQQNAGNSRTGKFN
jgi:hypothetical protein